MKHSIESLTAVLRVAREEKALSQRALSAKVAMPQSRLSKIESGAVDVRISTLLELARALDLEPMLIPRRLVPAVSSLIAQTGTQATGGEANRPVYQLDDDNYG